MMLHKSGVTHSLARFIAATQWDDIPAPVRHQAKRSLMNFFAVALAGCRTGPVEIALRSLAEFSGGRQATLVGRTERIDALSAAFLNAAGANVHDFCDTHLRTVIHPSAPVAPALLALTELRPVSAAISRRSCAPPPPAGIRATTWRRWSMRSGRSTKAPMFPGWLRWPCP
jgi:2-methylcitrate dehydratase PrpD